MKAKFVSENINFERGIKSKKDILDNLLNRKFSIELDTHNLLTKRRDDGKIEFDFSDEYTYYFYEQATSRGATVRITKTGPMGVFVEMTGTKEELIPALRMWDPEGRDLEEFEKALEGWGYDNQDDLWDFVEPGY